MLVFETNEMDFMFISSCKYTVLHSDAPSLTISILLAPNESDFIKFRFHSAYSHRYEEICVCE